MFKWDGAPGVSANETPAPISARLLVAGVGGNGSFAAETAVRLGFRNLLLCDHDCVELRNIARQDYTMCDIGRDKTDALAQRLRAIAPDLQIATNADGITAENVASLVGQAQIVLDAIDNYRIKVVLSRAVVAARVPKVHSSGAGYKGSVTTFMPGGIDYETMFGLPSRGRPLDTVSEEEFAVHRARIAGIVGRNMYSQGEVKEIGEQGQWPTVVVPCACAGAIAAFEAYKIAVGQQDHVMVAPTILEFDNLHNLYRMRELRDANA